MTAVAPPLPASDTTRRSSAARMLANTGLRAFADIGGKLGSLVFYVLLAREVGVAQYGVYMFALSYAGLVLTPGGLAQETLLTRRVAREPHRLEEYLSDVLVAKTLCFVAPLLVGTLVAGRFGLPGPTQLVVFILALGLIVEGQLKVVYGVFQAFERLGPVPVILILQRWSATIGAAVALFAGAGIVAVAAIYLAGGLLALVVGLVLIHRTFGRPRMRPTRWGWLRVTRESAGIGVATAVRLTYFRVDMTLLAALAGARATGQYAAAYRLLETTLFVSWSVDAAVLPAMSRLTRFSVPSVTAVYERALKLVLAITLPLAAGAAILAPGVIALLYGDDYAAAGPVLALLAPTIALLPVSAMTTTLLYTQGHQRRLVAVYLVALGENVVANLLVLPHFGAMGAAATSATSELLLVALLAAVARGVRDRVDLRRVLVGPAVATVAAAAAMWAMRASLPLAVAGGAVVYGASLLSIERRAFPEDFAVLAAVGRRLQRALALRARRAAEVSGT